MAHPLAPKPPPTHQMHLSALPARCTSSQGCRRHAGGAARSGNSQGTHRGRAHRDPPHPPHPSCSVPALVRLWGRRKATTHLLDCRKVLKERHAPMRKLERGKMVGEGMATGVFSQIAQGELFCQLGVMPVPFALGMSGDGIRMLSTLHHAPRAAAQHKLQAPFYRDNLIPKP